ncbi:MAG: OmpA family protein [Myxococcaceae bacterium]
MNRWLSGRVRVSALAVMLSAGAAFAQTPPQSAFPAERFRLTPDRGAIIDVEFGRVLSHLSWDAGLMAGYANDPMTVYRLSDGQRLGALVSERLGASLVGALGLFDWAQISLEVPLVMFQAGDAGIPGSGFGPLSTIRAAGLGDLRLIPKVRLLRSDQQGVDLALLASIYFPTSAVTDYLGDRNVIVTPELALSRRFGGLRLAANVAVSLLRNRLSVGSTVVENELITRFGAGFRFHEQDASWIPLELDAAISSFTGLSQPYTSLTQQALEFKAQAAWHLASGFVPFVGGGVGLLQGWGQPDWRIFAGVRFGSVTNAHADSDSDGFPDDSDRCPREPENVNAYEDEDGCSDSLDADGDGVLGTKDLCPNVAGLSKFDGCSDPDPDGDGVSGAADRCPMEAEDKDNFQDADGCPDKDNDGDGVADIEDRCPTEAGAAANRGCPDPDRDGDGIVDRLDTCADEKGTAENGGCAIKQAVMLTGEGIQILDKVFFNSASAVIQSRSFDLLKRVSAVIKSHPEIGTVRVDGHTDAVGDDAKNMALSQGRAESVRQFLIKDGVADARLKAQGWGETKPVSTNDTPEGRTQNRRVEFKLANE